jgi:hypothetical protein
MFLWRHLVGRIEKPQIRTISIFNMQMKLPRHLLDIVSLGIVMISTGKIFSVPTIGGPFVRPLDFKPPITMTSMYYPDYLPPASLAYHRAQEHRRERVQEWPSAAISDRFLVAGRQ